MHDSELIKYKNSIGSDIYKQEYHRLYSEARQCNQRYSGKEYTNSKEKISSIKEKYKNGVTDTILNEFISNL